MFPGCAVRRQPSWLASASTTTPDSSGETSAAHPTVSSPRSPTPSNSEEGAQERALALARLDSGASAGEPEAHFRLATTALTAGLVEEALAAARDTAEHAAPFERLDFRRRLDQLVADCPELQADATAVGLVLLGESRAEAPSAESP